MGWELIPWYTLADDFDKDFSVDEWHGTTSSSITLAAALLAACRRSRSARGGGIKPRWLPT
jgi:predicted dithiol-disulfide oxidoreductase (DUF899 family)